MAESRARSELRGLLQHRLQGEFSLDPIQRAIYATDASNHQITPLGVIFPKTESDLFAAVQTAAELGVPILPRGAGTSLPGSTIGRALVVDCSRYLANIRQIDRERGMAIVEPGVVCNQLNAAAAGLGMQYGPDPASADRATFGGMIGTNATGAHSIRYGMTVDHVVALEVVLADGSEARLEPLTLEAAGRKSEGKGLEADIYRRAFKVRRDYAAAVRDHWPRTWRRSSGYSLNYLTGYTPSRPAAWYQHQYPPPAEFNLASLVCGSEGTLAVIRSAEVRLVPRPAATVLLVIGFDGVAEAADFTPAILETEPAAVELIPRLLIERARQVPAYARRLGFVEGDPQALLVVEYTGNTQAEALAQADQLRSRGRLLVNPREQGDLWAVRKAGLGLLMSVPGDAKPITFMEDVAVPVEQLGRYVREVDRLLEAHGTHGEWYAHASAGCLHMRPLVNLRTADGVHTMREIADQVVDLVVRMKGSISGEHGDGLSHTAYNQRLFGPEIAEAFRELKAGFDPQGILNPGKVVAPGGGAAALDADLRYGPDYRSSAPSTTFRFGPEGGFAQAVESCIGVGICRKADGVMCPSFQATRNEMHSTRGRANALRAAISGVLPEEALTSRQMFEVLDLCLECKGCKSECPTQVDMARIKAEFLSQYQAVHGVTLRSRAFGGIAAALALAQPIWWLANRVAGSGWFRWLLERTLRIARERRLPLLAGRRFRRQFQPQAKQGERVVLFVDTFTEYSVPEVGTAAVRLLEAAGCRVELVAQQACCGRPMISKGLLERAKRQAVKNVRALEGYARQGVPIIGLEPSCISAVRDEYLDLLPDDDGAIAVAGAARLIEEYLTEPLETGGRRIDRIQASAAGSRALVHNHCHSKALVGNSPLQEMLRSVDFEVEQIDAGCCGMAGSFGYEAEHYDLSMQVGELKLFPAVRNSGDGVQIAAPGISCRTQLKDGTGIEAVHPVVLMAEAMHLT